MSMTLALITMGALPIPPRPDFPAGVVRTFSDPDKFKRTVPDLYDPRKRQDDIVAFIRANGPCTVEDLCDWTEIDAGTIGADFRVLRRAGRIVECGQSRQPNRHKQKLWSAAHAKEA